jgi:hypothetical protein
MPNVGLIDTDADAERAERDFAYELYSVFARYLKPSTISKLLNDIEGDIISPALPEFSSSIPFRRVLYLLQELHTHVLAQKAEEDERD